MAQEESEVVHEIEVVIHKKHGLGFKLKYDEFLQMMVVSCIYLSNPEYFQEITQIRDKLNQRGTTHVHLFIDTAIFFGRDEEGFVLKEHIEGSEETEAANKPVLPVLCEEMHKSLSFTISRIFTSEDSKFNIVAIDEPKIP